MNRPGSKKNHSGTEKAVIIFQHQEFTPDSLIATAKKMQAIGSSDLAAQMCLTILKKYPRYGSAAHFLGTLYWLSNMDAEASKWLKVAAETTPNADTLTDWAVYLNSAGLHQQAEKAAMKALSFDKEKLEAWRTLASVYTERGNKNKQAIDALEKALRIEPKCSNDWHVLAKLHDASGEYVLAANAFEKAVELAEKLPEYKADLIGALLNTNQHTRAYAILDDLINKSDFLSWTACAFNSNCQANISAMDLSKRHLMIGTQIESTPLQKYTQHLNQPDMHRKLNIGIVSGDLRAHPVGYFMRAVVSHLDKNAFQLVAYANQETKDSLSKELKQYFSIWRDVLDLSDSELGRKIVGDSIDILIDLSGHTSDSRLPVFALRPAPVQASYLGYFFTTGLKSIDYIIGNADLIPPNEHSLYSETPWLLPESHVCYSMPEALPALSSPPCTANSTVTFGSFGRLEKVNPEVIRIWANILNSLPDSQLILKAKHLSDPLVVNSIKNDFVSLGVNSAQLCFETSSAHKDYLAAYNRVDIVLDTFPYNGTTTTMDALLMGVPVLTVHGDRYCGHMAESVLNAAGLQEWVAKDTDDYIRLAVKYASDPEYLTTLRAGMRERLMASPLLDAPRFAKHFGDALRGMWRKWCAEQNPSTDSTTND